MEKKLILFDAKQYDYDTFTHINNTYNLGLTFIKDHLTDKTVEYAWGYRAVCLFVNDYVTPEIIQTLYAGGTRLIALRCAGCNNINVCAAEGKIKIVRVPAYSPHAVAEYTIGLIISLARKIHRATQKTRDNNFSIEHLLGFNLHGKTAGVVGAGLIGSLVIQYLHTFGMRVLVCDPHPDKINKTAAISATFEQLLRESDIVSLHCTLKEDNQYIMNSHTFASMKEGTLFINTARGKLVDTHALVNAIHSGHLAGAALDVYEHEEPIFYNNFSENGIEDNLLARLLSYPQVIISSHQAFFTREALHNIASTTLDNVLAFYENRPLMHEVRNKT